MLPCESVINKNKYVIISSLLFYSDVTVCSIFITMVKVRLLLVVLCLLLYCSFNFMYSLFYKPAMTTTKLPFVR